MISVFVCYHHSDYQGCSDPMAVFDNETDAVSYCNKYGTHMDYKELEMDETTIRSPAGA